MLIGLKIEDDVNLLLSSKVCVILLACRLNGTLPASLAGLSLVSLNLNGNSLTGRIPQALFEGSLNSLNLGNNGMTGTVPESIG